MSVVDKSPDAAKERGGKEAAANAAATKKRRELEAKHLADLKKRLGDVGLDNGDWVVGTDQNRNLVLYEEVLDKKGKPTGQRNEIFFWVGPDGLGFTGKYGSQVIKSVKTDFKGNLEVLRKQLFDKNFLSETDFKTKDETAFNNAILDAARNHTLTQVQSYTIEGNTKFSPFKNWLSGLGSADTGAGDGNLPLQDINLMDRDVVEAIVRDVYSKTTDMAIDDAFLKQETDRYMAQIKEGTMTTTKKVGGKIVRQQTKPFSQAQVEAELPKRIEKEQPGATDMKKSFDFLAFLDGLGAQVV
jgi:hypothetical protein